MKANRIWLIVALMALCGMASAQQQERKKVAVVLSGGGAKGMAHIGALKVIEQAGIPIDIVTGTSMGSIIGGLYAIGYNANSLDSLVRAQDWSYVITDKEDLAHQSLDDRKKQYTYALTRGVTIGKSNLDDGGLIKGKNISELFLHLCTGYTDSLDFSTDLPIPFACVATNIVDNTEYDFYSGKLPQAMRASMAIPGAFSPVRLGDMVLVDGGLRNNYPVDIAREMGADVVIGVTLQGKGKTADDLVHTTDILSQLIDVNCKNKYDDNLRITDLAIRVNTTGYGAASFNAAAIDTLIRRGEEEALKHWDDLMALKKVIGIDDSFHPLIHQPIRPAVMTERHHVASYKFENMTPQDERFLRQKFHLNKLDSIDAKLMQQITTSMRIDLFYQTAECRLEPVDKEKAAATRRRAPNFRRSAFNVNLSIQDDACVVLSAGNRKTAQLYAGLRYDNEEYAAVQLGADFPLRTAIPVYTDVTIRLGKRLMARGEFTLHPSFFTRPKIDYAFRRNDIDVYIGGDRDYSIRYNHHQANFVPINFDIRNFNLQAGLRWDYMHYRSKLVASELTKLQLDNDHYFSYHVKVNYNSENNWLFPTRGSRFKAEYAYMTTNMAEMDGKPGMSDINANWRTSFNIGKRFTLQPMLYGRLLFGANIPLVFGNVIGGEWFGHYMEQQMPFVGISNMEYIGKQFLAAQLQGQQRIADSHYVLLRLAAAQQSDSFKDTFDHKTLLGVQAAYYYNTMFGPLGAALGYSNHTRKLSFYLNLGYEF